MATSKAQLRAAAKWRRENMRSITIAFREDIVRRIEEAADREGITRDQWLKEKIKKALEES
jgi:metal-responsive CopG/Arc/MetJ family transcriptional regulator